MNTSIGQRLVDEVQDAASLVAAWIAAGGGKAWNKETRNLRFHRYAKVALRTGDLGSLLVEAGFEAIYRGGSGMNAPVPTAAQVKAVLEPTGDGSQRRMLLFYSVVERIHAEGIDVADPVEGRGAGDAEVGREDPDDVTDGADRAVEQAVEFFRERG